MLNVHLLAKSMWIWHQSCKFTVNHLVWRIRISKLNLGLAPKSCKYMQIYCKPAGLQDQDLKAEPGFGTKFMQIHCLPGGLDDQDTKSEISKIKFASWIRGFCRHLSHPCFCFNLILDVDQSWSVSSARFDLFFGAEPFPMPAAREPFFTSIILSVPIATSSNLGFWVTFQPLEANKDPVDPIYPALAQIPCNFCCPGSIFNPKAVELLYLLRSVSFSLQCSC